MMALLPLLLAPLAAAATVVSCPAEISVGGRSITVTGHGSDEAAAQSRAVLIGRQVGTRLVHSQVWREVFFTPEGAAAPSLLDVELEPQTGVPGATWTLGTCATRDIGEAETWVAELMGAKAMRADPGIALSAARRLACEPAWVDPVAVAFEKVAFAAAADKARLLADGLDAADVALEACYAATPDLRTTVMPRVDIGVRDGMVECRAAGPAMSKGPMGLGYGTTADQAIDQAGWERAHATASAGLAAALDARAHAAPETRAMLMAAGLNTALFAHDTELGELGLVSCVNGPDGGELAWGPRGPEDRECASTADFARWRSPDLVTAAQQRDAWCGEHARAGLAEMNKAVGGAAVDRKGTLQSAGWGVLLDCTNRCRLGTAFQGPNISMGLPGIAAFNEQTAVVLLAAAASDRDIGRASLVVPALNTRQARAMRAGDADRFWAFVDQLAASLRSGQLPPGARWGQFGGHAILMLER
jgi:hypothetical protein